MATRVAFAVVEAGVAVMGVVGVVGVDNVCVKASWLPLKARKNPAAVQLPGEEQEMVLKLSLGVPL